MKRLILAIGLGLGLSLTAACESPPDKPAYHSTLRDKQAVVYIVRHAEKQTGDNPSLTEEGVARAERLAAYLSKEPVVEVWSTDFARTKQTAAPVAEAHGVEIQLYDPGHNYRMADRVRDAKGVVLIVGHSNTIGSIAPAFIGDDKMPDLDESDYETLYWVTIAKDGHTQMYQSSYEGLERRVTE